MALVRLSQRSKSGSRSPDPGPIFGLEIELVPWFHTPDVVPRVNIAHRSVNAKARRRMHVGYRLLLERIGTGLGAPYLRPAKEHPLVAGVAPKNGRRLALQRGAIGVKREQKTAKIGD